MSPENILIITILLLAWNLFVVQIIAKWVYDFVKQYKDIPAQYVARKAVHILSGGITAILVPIFYHGYYWLVTVSAIGLGLYLIYKRHTKPMYWFQLKENKYEAHFAFAYGAILLVAVLLQNLLVGLIPLFFMSFGDSATGLIRAVTQKRHVKSWEGSLAMLIICTIIAYAFLGLYGFLVGIAATLVEKIPGIDDNITVPIVSAILVYLYGVII